MSALAALEQRITRLLSERMAREIPSTDADLIDAGAIDSMGFVDLLHHLESEFGLRLRLEDLDIDQFRSVSRIAAFVMGKEGAHVLGESGLHGKRSSVS
jgi:acyl carrier protein